MGKRVLIVTEEWAGSGHYMAALALKEALEEHPRQMDVTLIGGLATASPMLRRVSRSSYYRSLEHFPALWEKLYNREVTALTRTLQKPLAKLIGKRLLDRAIELTRPDLVISTHAYCLAALVQAKRKASKPFQLLGVLTDYHVHPYWVHPEMDYYLVAHPTLSDKLVTGWGVEQRRILSFGIPLRPVFMREQTRTKAEWKAALGLGGTRFCVLLCGGTDGHGELDLVVAKLLETSAPLDLVVITGKNAKLYQELNTKWSQLQSEHRIYILGYVETIWEWLGAADVVISKAGGLTCSEALAMGTPVILFQPLPGQERQNTRFLVDQEVAQYAASIDDILMLLKRQQAVGQASLAALTQRMQTIGRADSAYLTASWIDRLDTVPLNQRE